MASLETLTGGEFEAKVLRATVPVALDFYQATCPPCRALRITRRCRTAVGRTW